MIRTEDFASWEDFKTNLNGKLFQGAQFQRGRYLFRGQRDPHWPLTPTFDRMFANRTKSDRLRISAALLAHFRRSVEGLDEIPHSLPATEHNLLALGQHYGLPTRLLDWTDSPYVAAFFAYNSRALWGITDQKIAIWVLDTQNAIWSAQYGVEVIDVSAFGNKRLRNQTGKFTLSKTPFSSLEDYVEAHADQTDALFKCLLPAQDYARALADLDAMGIHHASVFPEIEGSAQMALFRTVVEFNAHIQTASTPRPA
jgi:hypothetical protein